MSTKKEKPCCDKCLSTDSWMKGECFNGDCPCHKSESVEWEKDLSFRFDSWLKLYPGAPSIGEIEEWWLESLRITIASAVEARERGIIEKVESERLSPSNYEQKTNEVKIKQREAYNKALDKVISIINTSKE